VDTNSKIKEALLKKSQGDIAVSESIFLEILDTSPQQYEALINLGLISVHKKMYEESIYYFKKAKEADKNNIDPYINLGNVYTLQQNHTNAIQFFELAHMIDQTNLNVINSLSFLYNEIDKLNESKKIITIGLKIDPTNHSLLNLLGLIFVKKEKISEAIDCYIQSINSKPNYWNAYNNLLFILEKTNKLDLFKKYLDDAKQIFTDQHTINLFEASYYMRKKNYLKSKKILLENQLIDKLSSQEDSLIKFHDLLAKNFDFLDESNSSFDNFKLRNNIKSNQLHNKIYDKNIILELIQNYKKYFTKINLNKFTKPEIPKKYQTPIFLVGFPRSGTTLLDSILRSHSKILVLEEKLIISSIRDRFFEKNNKEIKALESLSENDILSFQSEYFDKLHEITKKDLHNIIIIDKLPLNLIEVGFIKRIFPQSKFILMLRHPCDTVLSCFMSDFKINEGMASFYNLKDATILYNEVFSLWNQYVEVYDLAYHLVKYEEVVLNFDNTIRKTIDFLNLEWEENLKNFNATALARKKINTPSYNQVIQPLYKESINRWKKYDEMKKIYPSLEYWINKYNYN
jgi:Tfp pilus assembly protein PilF